MEKCGNPPQSWRRGARRDKNEGVALLVQEKGVHATPLLGGLDGSTEPRLHRRHECSSFRLHRSGAYTAESPRDVTKLLHRRLS